MMRAVSGFVLLAVGLAFAVFAYNPSSFDNSASWFDRVGKYQDAARPRVNEVASTRVPAIERAARIFSPISPLFADIAIEAPRAAHEYSSSWHTVVSLPSGRRVASASTTRGHIGSRYALARALQRELKRVGCYWGRLDGDWGPGSKWALRTFMSQVNSGLPTDEPDRIQLALLKTHKGRVCGRRCPAGQSVDRNGRCIGPAIIAAPKPVRALRERQPDISIAADTNRDSGATRLLSDETKLLAPATPVPRVVWSSQDVRDAPFTGRMSVGAPVDQPVQGWLPATATRYYDRDTDARPARNATPNRARARKSAKKAKKKRKRYSYKYKRRSRGWKRRWLSAGGNEDGG